jgi:hypothetical protein
MAVNKVYDIVGSFSQSDEPEFDPRRLVNLYIDSDPQGKNGKAAFTTAGLSLDDGVNFGGARIGRRLYVFKDILYAVVGENFYSLDDNLHFTLEGTLQTEIGYIGVADNGIEMCLVDGAKGYIWNPSTSAFTEISHAGFPTLPTDVSILGSRFVVSKADSNKLHFSAIEDGLTWNALDEFAVTSQPDQVVGLRRLNDRLFIMGNRVTEVWYDAGDPVLPYRRSDVLPYGCVSPASISEGFGFLIWLSNTDRGIDSVVLTTGTEPRPVSTKPILNEFERYTQDEDAESFISRNERGHVFYQLSFTTANKTWIFDVTERRWSQLEYDSADRHLARDHAYFNNKHYVIDYKEPHLYELSTKFFTDNGVNIRRRVVGPVLFDPTGRYITLHSVLFDLKQGVGAQNGIESDPKIRLQVSRDGGITYGNELSTPVGKIGEREYRSQFFRLGRSRSYVLRVTYDNDTPFLLMGSSVNIDVQQGGF